MRDQGGDGWMGEFQAEKESWSWKVKPGDPFCSAKLVERRPPPDHQKGPGESQRRGQSLETVMHQQSR